MTPELMRFFFDLGELHATARLIEEQDRANEALRQAIRTQQQAVETIQKYQFLLALHGER